MTGTRPSSLSPQQKKRGQGKYLWFIRWNTLSYAALADTILILFAIKLGADDLWVAWLTSIVYLTVPAMLIGKMLILRIGTTRTFGAGWLISTFSAMLMLLAPFLSQSFSTRWGMLLLTLAIMGFFLSRNIGGTATTPLVGDITSPEDQGEFLAKIWLNANIFSMIAILSIAFLLGRSGNLSMFQGIIAGGGVCSLIASFILFSIPSTRPASARGKQPLNEVLQYLRGNPRNKRFFKSWAAISVAIALTVPFSMLSLKKGYYFSDQNALLFSIVLVSGGIFVSFINSLLLDRVGPRPMLFLFSIGLGLVNILWAIAPDAVNYYHLAAIFLLVGICASGNQTSLFHYFLNSIPALHRLNGSILINIFAGTITGILATVFGGGALKLLRALGLDGLAVYRYYFLVIAIYQLFVLYQVYHLEPLKDRRIKDVLGVLFSWRDWRAMYTLQKLAHSHDEKKDIYLMSQLSHLGSNLSEQLLQRYLKSPRFYVRTQAISALRQVHFDETTAHLLINELQRGEFTSAFLAAEVLGEHKVNAAIPALRQAVRSSDVFLQGKAIIALTQLNDQSSFDEIIQIFKATHNPRLVIDCGYALALRRQPELGSIIFEKIIHNHLSPAVAEELLFSLSEVFGVGDPFYQLFHLYKNEPEMGVIAVQEFLETRLSPQQHVVLEIAQTLNSHQVTRDALPRLQEITSEPNLKTIIARFERAFSEIRDQNLFTKIMFSLLLIIGVKITEVPAVE